MMVMVCRKIHDDDGDDNDIDAVVDHVICNSIHSGGFEVFFRPTLSASAVATDTTKTAKAKRMIRFFNILLAHRM